MTANTCIRARAALFLAALGTLAAPGALPAAWKNGTTDGLLLGRARAGQPFAVVAPGAEVAAETTLVGLPGASIVSPEGAVQLTFLADLDGKSLNPILEPAVILHETPGFDLDFTLDRGRVEVARAKAAKKDVKVRLRCQGETWDVVLKDAGGWLAAETYGRWAPGVPFRVQPLPRERPLADVVLLAGAGEAEVTFGAQQWALKAPPGPAGLHWSNTSGVTAPFHLDRLPDWFVEDTASDLYKARKQALDRFAAEVKAKSLDAALDEFLASDNPRERNLAAVMLGATDDLPRLAAVLQQARHADLWDAAVVVFRHWIGRAPGQDQLLYKAMLAKGLKPANAATILQLLHSFGEDELAQPETYEVLIDYLDHEQLGVRGLAHWHLVRLVPEGRKIGYDPLAPREERLKAQKQWKLLIPEDKLPPRPRAK